MNCEHWENIKDELSLFGYSYCKITNQQCYCWGEIENCEYTEEKDEEN